MTPPVDLKYVTHEQKLILEYEGKMNVFEVNAVASQPGDKNASEDLVSKLEGLQINPAPHIWTVGWDTTVVILSADTPKPLEPTKVRSAFPLDTLWLTSMEAKPADGHRSIRRGWRIG